MITISEIIDSLKVARFSRGDSPEENSRRFILTSAESFADPYEVKS